MKTSVCVLAGCAALLWAAMASAQPCQGDFNGDGKVTINELIVAVNNALYGCPGSGQRFVDNGDETISDRQTGLMWEKKENLDGTEQLLNPRDADNAYTLSSSGSSADGTAFTNFLPSLNSCVSSDGATVAGGFAGHCDWRLPTIAELRTIVDLTASGCGTGDPCIPSVFGPTQADGYWSATTFSSYSTYAWAVNFGNGGESFTDHTDGFYVRAVRGGL